MFFPRLVEADPRAVEALVRLAGAGTPLWVATEGIDCPSDGDPKTEDECFEISAP